ncbi:MAG TPA: hypothetical protein VMZ03_03960 [Chitinophagaceae bacterium]|nr:hypothetical protein [Chitinophagaceae bacterium]
MTTINPEQIEKRNAIMFSDGETWYMPTKPDASFGDLLNDWKNCGGNPSVTMDYPGLQVGQISATLQDYADNIANNMSAFFLPSVQVF